MNQKCKDNWDKFVEYIVANPEIKNISHNNLTFYQIISNIEDYLPYIYEDINTATKLNSAGLMVLSSYSYRGNKDSSINWTKEVTTYDINTILKKISLSYASAQFICKWVLSVIIDPKVETDTDTVKIIKSNICDNYPYTALKVFETELSDNNCKDNVIYDLLEYCKNIVNTESEIGSIKDLSTPYIRRVAYLKNKLKQNEKINKKAEEQSVFLELVKKTPIKYGSRSAFIQNINDGKILSENAFQSFEYSIELPRLFTSDPAYYNRCLLDIFRS